MASVAYAGRNVRWGIDGYDLSGQGNDMKVKRESAVIDTSTFGTRFESSLSGIQKAMVSYKGFYADGAVLDSVIHPRFGQDSDIYTWQAPKGLAALNPIEFMPGVITKYDKDTTPKKAVEFDLEMHARGYYDIGFVYASPLGFTTATGNSTAIDNLASSPVGGNAQLHVWSATGTTPSATFKVQHSPDNSTWTDLATFTAVTTGQVAQRVVLDPATVVNQYTRGQWTVSGTTPQFKALLMFSRNVNYS